MKIGFSSRVCPEWDLSTIVRKAAELGFDGVELGTLDGKSRPPAVRDLDANPYAAKQLFADNKVELACLSSAVTFDSPEAPESEAARRRLLEIADLSANLACRFVRVPIGNVAKGESRPGTLSRIADSLAGLAPEIARRRVTLLVENGGDFADSRDLWFVIDAVSHPAVAACWNPCAAMARLERPTLSIPRLGTKIRLVHVCDAAFDDRGRFGGFTLPGEGDIGMARMIDLLRGIIYRGYLMFDWPKAAYPALAEPEEVLPNVKAWLRERIDARAELLTAYKGDKQAIRFKLPPGMAAPAAAEPVKAKH